MAGPRTPNSRSATATRSNGAARTLERLQRGLALHQAGRLGEAIPIYEEILAREPTQPDACHLLGVIRLGQGNTAEAVRLLRIAARGASGNPQYAANLVAALNAAENYLDAVTVADRLIKAHPDFAGGWNNRGMALKGRGALQEAVASYRRAVELQPDYPPFGANLGNALRDRGELAASIDAFRAVLARAPDHEPAVTGLARSFYLAQRFDDLRTMLQAAPEQLRAGHEWHFHLGRARQGLGELAAAEQSYDEAIRVRPDFAEALHAKVLLRWTVAGDPLIGRLQALADDPQRPVGDRLFAGFALGRALADIGEAEGAVDAFETANGLQAAGQEAEASLRQVQRLLDRFETLPPGFAPAALREPTGPVFVIGLSRSGKTTVEHLLAAMPGMIAGGELPVLGAELGGGDPGGPADGVWRDTLAKRYDTEARKLVAGTGRVIDTMPPNLLRVPYIVSAMSHARIVWCRRDPADLAIALFEKYLTGAGYDYATGIDRAVDYIEATDTLVRLWQRHFPGAILELDAATLVDKTVRRDLLVHCGIDPELANLPPRGSEPRLGEPSADSRSALWSDRQAVYRTRFSRL